MVACIDQHSRCWRRVVPVARIALYECSTPGAQGPDKTPRSDPPVPAVPCQAVQLSPPRPRVPHCFWLFIVCCLPCLQDKSKDACIGSLAILSATCNILLFCVQSLPAAGAVLYQMRPVHQLHRPTSCWCLSPPPLPDLPLLDPLLLPPCE